MGEIATLERRPEQAREIVAEALASQAWAEPDPALLETEREPAPGLPLDVFGPAARWIETAAEGAGAPVDYVAGTLLGAAGTLLANVRQGSPWKGWREPSHLYITLVGSPSQGKTPAVDPIRSALKAIEKDEYGEYEIAHADWTERKIVADAQDRAWRKSVEKAIEKGEPAPPRPDGCTIEAEPMPPRIVVGDTTTEKLGELMRHNRRGLQLFRDELAGWIGNMDRYSGGGGGGDRAFYLESYNGRPFSVDRKAAGSSFIVDRLSIGILGTIQPDRLDEMLLRGADDGLVARLLYIFPEPRRPRRPTRAADHGELEHALRRLRSLHLTDDGEPIVVPFTEAAARTHEEWREYLFEIEGEAAGMLKSWQGKLPGVAVRLATTLTFLQWAWGREKHAPTEIDADALEAATTFLDDYAIPMARRTLGEGALKPDERDGRRLARWLRDNRDRLTTDGEGRVVANPRELRRMERGPGIRQPAPMKAAVNFLKNEGVLRDAPTPTGGRPRGDVLVNPLLWEARP